VGSEEDAFACRGRVAELIFTRGEREFPLSEMETVAADFQPTL